MGRSQFNNEFTAMVQFGQFPIDFFYLDLQSHLQGLSTAKIK